ncbi:(d)CMP kinase [soil metagenome]
MIVAIDGPAGSGKSTTARRLADRLGWLYLDTGAMYRAVGLALADAGLDDESVSASFIGGLDLRVEPDQATGMRVFLDGIDVTARLRTPEAGIAASRVSRLAAVRDKLVAVQRKVARERTEKGGGVVLEGRDIGTVVFPEAEVKVFMVAGLDARAGRRAEELSSRLGLKAPSLDTVRAEIAERDRRDQERSLAPLKPAPDAVRLDTSDMSIEDQVERVLSLVQAHQSPN